MLFKLNVIIQKKIFKNAARFFSMIDIRKNEKRTIAE